MNDVEDLQLFWFYGFKNILNLRYIDFQTKFLLKTDGLLAKLTGSVSLPDELRYLRWTFYPFTSLSQSFNPKELVVLKLSYSNIQQLWNERYQDLVNLRTIDLQECSTLRKIPNLRGAINLRNLICRGCDGLVDLSYLSHLTSLENLDLTFCINLRRMPNLLGAINLKTLVCCGCESLVQLSELPDNVTKLDLSVTGIEEVADSIQHLVGLRELNLSFTRVENVLSNISKLESLRRLDLSYCERLKTLQELPQYLWRLDASGCMSLEKVSFTDHNFNSLHSLHDGDDAPQEEHSSMLFSNCRSLSQDSIKNISANAILQIQSLSQRWIRREGISREEPILDSLLCCFPGNEVSANEFEHRSENSWLNLKISPIGSSRSKFLVFCICLVADLTLAERNVAFFGKYQLTAASGEKLTGVCMVDETFHRASHGNGDHVFILFSKNMIRIDKDYKEASFEFHAENDNGEEFKLEKCGVHVFYVDAESYTITEMRHGDEGRFGNDSEGGATCHPNA
ncbi:hypothetical protein V6N12_019449 [Hibiscus sabdariffa]|uniref:Uncharacterized protein n=1 Tax=Hibiscus sabdariffa TaxID=183260 RepID=A0ABR2BNV2_9ROSI